VNPACFQCHRTTPMESGGGHAHARDMQPSFAR
jgi:hypothetical protein